MNRPSVMITAIVCGMVTVLGFVAAVTFLAYTGRGTEALAAAVITPVLGLLLTISNRQKQITAQTLQQNSER